VSKVNRKWMPRLPGTTIPIRFTATDLQALTLLRGCLGTPDTTRTVRAALGAAVSMVQGLMNQQGFTTADQFQVWWRAQAARAAAGGDTPNAEVFSDVAGASTASTGETNDTTQHAAAPDVAQGAAVP
jgi:hypothetical protein